MYSSYKQKYFASCNTKCSVLLNGKHSLKTKWRPKRTLEFAPLLLLLQFLIWENNYPVFLSLNGIKLPSSRVD